jgi:PASTA domain
LRSLTQPEAEAKLQEVGFVVGAVEGRHNDLLPKGRIIGTDPTAGALASLGSPVELEVSKGPLSLWPLIPGALITLIELLFLILVQELNGVIFCYVGVMTLIVGAGAIWRQYIAEQPDLDTVDHAQMENAILVLCCFFGMVITGLAVVCGATVTVFKDGMTIGLLWGLGSLFSGGFIGFLFGIPSETETKESTLHINTSLNQVADWLTKIIVGSRSSMQRLLISTS